MLAGKKEREITNICWTSTSIRHSTLHLPSYVILRKALQILSYLAHFSDEESLSQKGCKTSQDPLFNKWNKWVLLIMISYGCSFVKEYHLLWWNKLLFWVLLMFNAEKRTFWWKEVTIDSSTSALRFCHQLTPIVQPLPGQGILSGSCSYRAKGFPKHKGGVSRYWSY